MSRDIKNLIFIYTIMIMAGWIIGLKHTVQNEFNEKIEAMSFAIELNKINDEYIEMLYDSENYIENLKFEMQSIQDANKLLKDFRQLDKPYLILALCYTESSLKYNVKHQGKFDRETTGICGIKSYWTDIIPELTESNINSLQGGELVVNFLLEKNNNNLFEALKDYKGSVKNLKPVYRVLEIYKELK